MNDQEFKCHLLTIIQDPAFTPDTSLKFQQKIRELLGDYLWEGKGFHQRFNNRKYQVLCLEWHPDKKCMSATTKQATEERKFLLWVEQNYQGTDLLIKALNDVKNTNYSLYATLLMESFPALNVLIWPVLYLWQLLEENIGNYRNDKIRKFTAGLHLYSSVIPYLAALFQQFVSFLLYLGSFILPVLGSFKGFPLVTSYFAFNPWSSICGFALTYSAKSIGSASYKVFMKEPPKSEDYLYFLFVEVPFAPVYYHWRQHKNADTVRQKQKMRICLATSGILGILQIAAHLGALYLIYPACFKTFEFMITILLLMNTPLLLSNLCYDPKYALATVLKYANNVYDHYNSLIRRASFFIPPSIKNAVKVLKRNKIPQHDHNSRAPKQDAIFHQQAMEYCSMDESALGALRITLRKERNQCLKARWNIQDGSPFYERLEEALTQQSTPMDECGHAILMNDKEQQILQILNVKAQILFLKAAADRPLTANQLALNYNLPRPSHLKALNFNR